ncbi:ISAs1 family transposase [Candidatus Mycobacterium methanotrophicum]|uniref:ISAs1 family transposase n=1 Tax=Candidatus Mycobacterium methanotrophicum TaxID=2943498 RepID=UPI001C57A825
MWTRTFTAGQRRVIAVDGKTVRGARTRRDGKAPHLVAAFDHGAGVVPGQVAVDAKSNEIPAVRTLLGHLDLDGAAVTLDAMHTQTDTASASAFAGRCATSPSWGQRRRCRKPSGSGNVARPNLSTDTDCATATFARFSSATSTSDVPVWTTTRSRILSTCSLGCFGPTSRPTTPIWTPCTCRPWSPTRGSSAPAPACAPTGPPGTAAGSATSRSSTASARSTSTSRNGRWRTRPGRRGPRPARCGAATPTVTATPTATSSRTCTNASGTGFRSCRHLCVSSTTTAPIRPPCWRQPTRHRSVKPSPTGTADTGASSRPPTTSPNTAVSHRRCWWRIWPPANGSTSPTPKTRRSGRGRSWKRCATPEFGSRN